MKKKKLNIRLLRKIQKHILAEPLRLDMMNWNRSEGSIPEEQMPPCETTGCIAGWALMLSYASATYRRILNEAGITAPLKASKLLGIEYNPPEDTNEWSRWNAYGASGEAIQLFDIEGWPGKFRTKYIALEELVNDQHERKEVKKLRLKQAKITSDRIDHFIKHRE